MAVILAKFKDRPDELIGRIESMGAVVFERSDGQSILLLIACEPVCIDLVIQIITPIKEVTWEPFSAEVRGMFDTTPEPVREGNAC